MAIPVNTQAWRWKVGRDDNYDADEVLFHVKLHHPARTSRALSMLDALAALQGWPAGPGAPVCGWARHTGAAGAEGLGLWVLSNVVHGGRSCAYSHDGIARSIAAPTLEGVAEPMAALESVWRAECVR